MSISYEQTGRTAQKDRTRAALVQAVRQLLAQGVAPTVEQVAAAAFVSRPTAYHYLPNQRSLLIAANPEITRASLLAADAPSDPVERLKQVASVLSALVLEHEAALRAMLRLSLEDPAKHKGQPLRTGRRILWVEDALAPLRRAMTQRRFRKLVLGIAAALGIEAFVWLTDVAGLSAADAVEQMQWAAVKLLRCAKRDPDFS
jgi:AcrR family transcriptional regulator